MREHVRGLTWDHPRGTEALRHLANRARAEGSLDLRWETQSLEGFESASVGQLARDYDLIVLDHPHLGEATTDDAIWPLDALFDSEQIAEWGVQAVGPSQRSYEMSGYTWALPLDAATQVSVRRADLLPSSPVTWSDVVAVAQEVPTALCLAGPHAVLTFSALCIALGEEPAKTTDTYVSYEVGAQALHILRRISDNAVKGIDQLNPIQLLERMATGSDVAYCPLVYGYVNYAQPGRAHLLTYGDAPVVREGGRHGSVIGGTGIAVSRRCSPGRALLDHLRQVMSPAVQRDIIPAHAGQPGCVVAWEDTAVAQKSNDFYRATRATIDDSWIRPRYRGYITFQAQASQIVRDGLDGRRDIKGTLTALHEAHAQHGTSSYRKDCLT